MPLEAVAPAKRADDRLATSLKLTRSQCFFDCGFNPALNCCDGLVHNDAEVAVLFLSEPLVPCSSPLAFWPGVLSGKWLYADSGVGQPPKKRPPGVRKLCRNRIRDGDQEPDKVANKAACRAAPPHNRATLFRDFISHFTRHPIFPFIHPLVREHGPGWLIP